MNLSELRHNISSANNLTRHRLWGVVVVVVAGLVLALILGLQKSQNDHLELTQPNRSFKIEAKLVALPVLGQTFIPRQAGLHGIYLPLNVTDPGSGEATLTLHLRTNPTDLNDLRTVTVLVRSLIGQELARFSFDPLPDSANKRYYFTIESTAEAASEASVTYEYGPAAAYTDGAMYLDGQPQDFQGSFILAYDRGAMLRDWVAWLSEHLGKVLALILLILLPGAALLIWLWPTDTTALFENDTSFNHIEWVALAAALSVAVYPILLLYSSAVGLSLNSEFVAIFLSLCAVAVLGGAFYRRSQGDRSRQTLTFRFSLPIILFWVIFVLSAAVRIVVVRGQPVPLWQDSYHHTIISQLILDHGGLFNSWQPYAPIQTFTYHFGFHTFAALYVWLTGSNIFQAVLTTGQTMNLLAVPVVFLLGRRLGGNDWVGTFAALLTGLLLEYPMFYVNWGRYTQLTGQVILPLTMILTWLLLNSQKFGYKLIILTVLSLTGLMLTHYRVLFFYPCFVLPLFLLKWSQARWQMPTLWRQGLRLGGVGLGSLLLVTPWLWRLVSSRLMQTHVNIAAGNLTSQSMRQVVSEVANGSFTIFDYVLPPVVLLATIGLVWGCWQRHRGILLTVGWMLFLVGAANPHYLYLPGVGIITYFAVLIAAYLPFSVLAGFSLGQVTQRLISWHQSLQWLVFLAVLGLGLLGGQARLQTFQPDRAMVTSPDLAAMAWIRENTPPEATFWINARQAYGGVTIVGTDAGWWIPFLTERHSFVPPMIYGVETPEVPGYPYQLYLLYTQVHQTELGAEETWQTLREAGVSYIYIGQRRGEVWRGSEQPLDPNVLRASPYYQLVYQRDEVQIFALAE